MEYIYALKCQKNKYYIGKTYNVQIEYNEHLDGTFCDVTKEYKPCDIDSIFELTDDITLNLVISKYVIKFGKENIFFEDTDVKKVKKLIKQNNIHCVCEENHWLEECKLNLKDDFWKKIFNNVFNKMTKTLQAKDICVRCGRYGHDMDECYARKHVDGYELSDDNDVNFI
jgi:predicted GIY-YIG superfamily endonuclease